MVLNSIDPQGMTNAQIQYCRHCGKRVSETDKFCPNCKNDLSKVGRNISLTISDYIKLTDEVKLKISPVDLKWDAQSLTFLGVIATIFLGISTLVFSIQQSSVLQAFLIGLVITVFSLTIVTKFKLVKNLLIKIILWFL